MNERIESPEEFVEEFIAYRFLHPQPRKKRSDRGKKHNCTFSNRRKLPDAAQLQEMYNVQSLTAGQIAEAYGTTTGAIRSKMRRLGVRKEKHEEA